MPIGDFQKCNVVVNVVLPSKRLFICKKKKKLKTEGRKFESGNGKCFHGMYVSAN